MLGLADRQDPLDFSLHLGPERFEISGFGTSSEYQEHAGIETLECRRGCSEIGSFGIVVKGNPVELSNAFERVRDTGKIPNRQSE